MLRSDMCRPFALFATLVFAFVALACSENSAPRDVRPNIVLLIADDQDWEHLGFLGHELAPTPTLDALAAHGCVFPTAYVTMSRCRPSLASLLSGLAPHEHGITFNRGSRTLDPARALPALLAEAGYATFLGGKFWEGDPTAFGFAAGHPDPEFGRAGQEELFTFIDAHAGERPLFLWWAPYLPHTPHDAPASYLARVDRDAISIPPHFDRPEWARVDRERYLDAEHRFLATVAWFDDCLAALRGKLEAAGILEDTLFLFLIDNGSAFGLPSKGSPFEKGLRTPIVVSWPGRIPEGALRDQLISSLDLYPTILDYAGVEIPATASGGSLRAAIEKSDAAGRDVLHAAAYPREEGEGDGDPRGEAYALTARTRDWKYVRYLKPLDAQSCALYRIKHEYAPPVVREAGDEDLYDLRADPYELDDLAERPEHAARLTELRAGTTAWWDGR